MSRAAAEARRADTLAEALAMARRALTERPGSEGAERLLVSTGTKQQIVPIDEVEWFGSAGNYIVVNWKGREGLIRQTLASLELRLDPQVFARSHRSTIVNLARVRAAASLSDGSWRLTLESGAELVVSRTYRDAVLGRLRG
jgi:DNA-binding LytR/AlgR family response regulator